MLKKAFQLGLFDPPAQVPFAQYGPEKLDTAESRQLAFDASTQTVVLLRNDPVPSSATPPAPLLPLASTTKVAVIGPHFNASMDLLSNYHGENRLVKNHTPLLAMERRGNVVGHAQGAALWGNDESGFAAAVEVAAKAEVAVVFLGLHGLPNLVGDA